MSDVVTTGSAGAAPSSSAPSTAGSSSTPASSSPAPATAAPATSPNASAAPATSGEPPRERWDDILHNTRTKTRSEVEAEYRQKYGWADQFQQNPYQFVENWIDQLAEHPQYSPQILAKAARMLQSRRGAAQTSEEPAPDVPIVDAHGNVTGQTYSAKQLKAWREWDWAQKQAGLEQRLQPLEQMRTVMEQRAAYAQVQQQSDEYARTTLQELRQDPHFKEHEAKVKQALIDHPEWGDNVHRAYHHVLQTDVFPTISRSAETKVLADLKTQAAGGSIRPDGAGTATPDFKKMKPEDVMRFMHDHPDIAEQYARGRS